MGQCVRVNPCNMGALAVTSESTTGTTEHDHTRETVKPSKYESEKERRVAKRI